MATSSSFLGYFNPYSIKSGTITGTWNTILPNLTSTTSNQFKGDLGSLELPPTGLPLIENVWGITSPNKNDQIFVMTNDSKYIFTMSYIMLITLYLFELENIMSADSKPNPKASIGYTNGVYYSINVILQYGFAPSGSNFINIMQMLAPQYTQFTNMQYINQSGSPITFLLDDAPADAYAILSKLTPNTPIYNALLYSKVCLEIANNGSNANLYLDLLDPTKTIRSLIKPEDWKYTSNYFNTIYTLKNQKQPSNFCIDNIYPSDSFDTASIQSLPTNCKTNPVSASLITINGKSYGNGPINAPKSTPTSTPTASSSFWTTTGILAIILCIVLLIIGFVLIWMMIPKKSKSSNSYIDNSMYSKGGYFYSD
jgi:hypothetical protein